MHGISEPAGSCLLPPPSEVDVASDLSSAPEAGAEGFASLPLSLFPEAEEEFCGANEEVIATAAIPKAVLLALFPPWMGGLQVPGFLAKAANSFCLSFSLSAAFLLNVQADWKMKL